MIVILGLVILAAAVIGGVTGVLGNGGDAHALTHGFAVFGYHVTGSTGTLFLYGIVVGAIAMLGLSLLLAGARRTSRRGSGARRELKLSRRETATANQERDDLVDQRDAARAELTQDRNAPAANHVRSVAGDGRWHLPAHPFGRRSSPGEASAAPAAPAESLPAAGEPGTADESIEVSRP